MPETPDFDKEVQDLNTRLADLEHRFARMREGFVKNDLGIEDYDGHRRDHFTRIEQDKVVSGYKRTLTQRLLEWGTAGLGLLLGLGIVEWLRAHLK